jgi:hypothetical protein
VPRVDSWQYLPTDVLEEEKADTQAKVWGTNQRTIAAKAWADTLRKQATDLYQGFTKIVSDEGPYPGSLPTPEEPADPYDKLTRSQGRQPEKQGFDFPTPEIPLPGMSAALRTPFGPSVAPLDLPGQPAKPVPPDEEEQRNVLSGKMPFADVEQAVGGTVRRLTKQGESLPGGGEGMPGFRPGGDDALRGRAFAQGAIETGGDLASTARGVKAAGVSPNQSMGQAVSPAEAAIRKMYIEPEKRPPDPTTPGRLERIRRTFVRAATDERVDLNELVNEARRALGRPLTSAEEVGEIVRLNSPVAAAQRVKETLKPAMTTVRKVLGEEGPVLLRTFLTVQDNVDKAASIGRRAGPQAEAARKFSGDVDVAQSQEVRDAILARLPPEQRQVLEAAAQTVWDFGHDLLRRKREAGIIDADTYQTLTTQFPHYTPVKILDYLSPDSPAGSKGKKIGLSSQDIKRLTVEGSPEERLDPITAMVQSAFKAEGDIQKNRAFTGLLDLQRQVPEIGRFFRPVDSDYTAKSGRGEQVLEGFVDGEKVRYAVPYDLHQAVTLANKVGEAPAFMQQMMSVWKNLVTGANATFVAANAPLDAMTYVIRQASREGGPQHIPSVAKSLLSAYGEVFQGLTQGEFRGKTAEYLREGGGVFGMTQRTPAKIQQFTDRLDRPNPFTIRNAKDVGRIVVDVLKLEPVKAVAERVELAARRASFERAQTAGKRTQEAVIQGRDVTLDFERAGSVARVLNSYVPFFNVATQAGVNLARAYKENPKGFALTVGSVVATPTLLTELWNRADPDREAAYEDVPDYIKRRSLVVMLPFTPGVDDRGNPRPPFVEIRLREMMAIAAPLREATARVLGDDGDGMKEMALTMLANVTPLNYSDVGEVPFELMGPGIGTAAQLAADRDTFRQRPIATEYADENAAEIAQMASRVLGGRPSQWEFAARNLLGTYAQMGLPASNLLAGRPRKETGAVQDTPVVGGLLRKMGGVVGGIGAETGQRLADAREKRALPADVTKALTEAGIRYDPSPVKGDIEGTPLTRVQQERYQLLVNKMVTERARAVVGQSGWETASKAKREEVLEREIGRARALARDHYIRGERARRKAS